jgi:hypothetical protein
MAYHEMRFVMSKVLWNLDLEFCEESEGWLDQKVFTIWHKEPMVVKVRMAGQA